MDFEEVAGTVVERFATEIRATVPLVSLWVHGSLAGGDFQFGRSDFDLLAVIAEKPGPEQVQGLETVHRDLIRDHPVAAKLHCSYMERHRLRDPGIEHLTWAFQEMFHRPVSPVIRSELLEIGATLYGPAPGGMIPPVPPADLAAFVREELDGYWRRVVAKFGPWLSDTWIDVGPLTLARATVTLRGGGMISKREAFPVLLELGAPADLVSDIYDRRYGRPVRTSPGWRLRRARLARAFMAEGIDRALASA
ncbi:nucleotidyltransferase [Spongiactinospora sp. TRM90649]|uniref:nucleotidyltransferase n=1 Tax=Spongiactinospora sp. TRM90649 TaxID=3031114 RepID=UPI0023F6E9B0|nr:nucleotidyltransferase [Spongiactinospora sp. TRM90649]MDF5751873.1 nucleotidyltransferase [Spongiactinospora sp. TRM90649]